MMKRLAFLFLACVCITGNLFAAPADAKPITVAVVGFATPEDSEVKSEDVSVLLTTLLSATPSLALVEREELSKILGEIELGLSGTVDGATAARVGQLTGAKVLVTGRMFNAGKTEFMAAKVIGTDTGRVFGLVEKYGESTDFSDAAAALSVEIAETIAENSAALLPAVETDEERIVRLRKTLGGKKLPSVFVDIPEEHISNRIPDPAAQTEIQKTFQDLGFTIVDNEAAADFVITGEAFSELAGRRANLVSCRARIEVKTHHKDAGDEIKVERETSVAVDLAENLAAKSALQEAGKSIAERLVVQSVQ